MWCWRRIEKISWTDHLRNEELEEINVLDTVRRGKNNWIGHILHRNCLLTPVVEENVEGT
jgi:hypothetical protein